ncbi:hypothetical protein ACOMHN_056289 [Nucella lapillus]
MEASNTAVPADVEPSIEATNSEMPGDPQSAMSASPEASGTATEKDTTLLTSQPLMEASNTTVPADVKPSMEASPEASGTATERDTTLLASNIVVLVVFAYSKRMRTRTNLFLANLAVADFCVGVFCVLPSLSIQLSPVWTLGRVMCKLYFFVNYLA